eukprot:9289840-Pyramimonas_sp.AAC.1
MHAAVSGVPLLFFSFCPLRNHRSTRPQSDSPPRLPLPSAPLKRARDVSPSGVGGPSQQLARG